MENADVIVVGAGLSGLSAAFELAEKGKNVMVLESRPVLGGRTSSWQEDDMAMESGLHRFLSFYTELPRLLNRSGVDVNKILHWESKIELRIPDGPHGVFGTSLLRNLPGLIAGGVGNNDILSPKDKASLATFLTKGLLEYASNPTALDKYSVFEYAQKHSTTDNVINTLLYALTAGLFFLPPDQYSAFVFFNTLSHLKQKPYDFREGAFMGGMTDVMINPIVKKIEKMGGVVKAGMPVNKLLYDGEKVSGVQVGKKHLKANAVVLASSLGPAKKLIRDAFGRHKWFKNMLDLPQMPERNLQIELTEPMLPFDHVVFGTYGTYTGTFNEQSRTTFRNTKGRLSIVLAHPHKLVDMSSKEIYDVVVAELKRYGIDVSGKVKGYKVVTHDDDWYSLSPGSEKFKPTQKTPIPGFALAGDYTKQEFLATMEGAVISGKLAADAIVG